MPLQDQETRQRLLETAARLFAARGFNHVTVREICHEARANVAAVNYHFRDKLGLYTDVVNMAIEAMRTTSDEVTHAASDAAPEERLRAYVLVHLRRLTGHGHASWIHQLMLREMTDPTPVLDVIVEQGVRPRWAYLAAIVAELIGCAPEDPRVRFVVASIQGQFVLYAPNPLARRLLPQWPPAGDELQRIADRIAEFSLAGIRALASAATAARHAARDRA